MNRANGQYCLVLMRAPIVNGWGKQLGDSVSAPLQWSGGGAACWRHHTKCWSTVTRRLISSSPLMSLCQARPASISLPWEGETSGWRDNTQWPQWMSDVLHYCSYNLRREWGVGRKKRTIWFLSLCCVGYLSYYQSISPLVHAPPPERSFMDMQKMLFSFVSQ